MVTRKYHFKFRFSSGDFIDLELLTTNYCPEKVIDNSPNFSYVLYFGTNSVISQKQNFSAFTRSCAISLLVFSFLYCQSVQATLLTSLVIGAVGYEFALHFFTETKLAFVTRDGI